MRNLGYFAVGVLIAAVLVVGTSWDWLQQPINTVSELERM